MVTTTDSLSPIQTNEFLPPISRWTTWGGMFIVFTLALAMTVASVTKYKVTVKGQAVIRPVGELRIVQAATEGQIMDIKVQENQVVKKGDAIATIDDSKLQTKKSQLQSSIQQAKLQLVQINAQISAINTQIRAETDRQSRAVASTQAELSGRQREYQDKKITTVTEVQEAEANVRMAEEELHKASSELKAAQANLNATIALLGAAQTKRNRYESVAKVGALPLNQLEEAQLAVSQQQQAVEAQKAVVQGQKQTIARLQQAVSAAIGRREGAQAALNPSNAAVASLSERIAQEKASGEANKATLDKERQSFIKQRIEIQQTIERDVRELQQVETDLKQTTITATADGIISKLSLRNSGQTVRAGEEIMQIVPSNAPVEVKAAIASENKGKLKIGQQVQMRVSACPYPDYGTLKGKVTAISPDAIASLLRGAQIAPQRNAATPDSPPTGANPSASVTGSFYEVTIVPETLALGKGKQQCAIQLGMQGKADIISREETVLQFFLRKARLIADV